MNWVASRNLSMAHPGPSIIISPFNMTFSCLTVDIFPYPSHMYTSKLNVHVIPDTA